MNGHILKVDGGRSLTNSGFVPWEGYKMMNRRFEPTSKNMMGIISKKLHSMFSKGTIVGSPEWISE